MRVGEAGVLLIEVAAGAVIQATDLRGPIAAITATFVIVATVLCLVARRGPQRALSTRMRSFVDDRMAASPDAADDEASEEYERDSLDCYRRQFARAVRSRTQRLRRQGVIGPREARRLNRPRDLDEIAAVADRLAEYEVLARDD